MARLRPVLLDAGLTEQIKWRKPCYSHEGANILILQEMKDFLAVIFFKGALLADPVGVLEDQGPNSRSARRIRLTSVEDVDRLAATVAAYVAEAIDVEEAGLEIGPTPELVLVEELQNRFDGDPVLAAAFEKLTPGRRREYNLHISGAKQAATRQDRVDKCAPRILDGKG
ncbi:MAG: YdeI/OmpD-associated family protein, partial [Acidimicrobiia bacterium]|nr:YdeI/OmpD-associated family protein [Acidimicrobiia bacterium]